MRHDYSNESTPLRHVQLAPAGPDATAIRTFSRRWFRLPGSVEQTVATLHQLSDAESVASGMQRQLLAMLIEGGSAVAVTGGSGVPLQTAGDGPLLDTLRRVDPELSSVPELCLTECLTADAGPGLVLLVPAELDAEDARAAVTALRAAGRHVLPFAVFDGRGWLGPLLIPSGPLVLTDVIARLAANADRWPGAVDGGIRELGTAPDPVEMAWLASAIRVETARVRAGHPALTDGYLVELDPSTLSVVRHPVLPWPDGDNRPPVPVGRYDAMSLVDDRTGVVNRLSVYDHHPDIPRQLISVHAHVSRMRDLTCWKTDSTTAGTSFESAEAARHAAIGEAVERYCGNIVQPDLIRRASWHDLTRAGEYALDPDSLVLFSDRQYEAPGFPFRRFTRDLPTHWVRGRCLTQDRPAWLPASLSYGNWHSGPYRDDAPIANLFFAGLAAGPDLDFAVVSALQEIVERHATMIWWANAHPLPSIREFPAGLAALWDGAPADAGQRAWLVPLPNEFDIPVMAGFVEHTTDRLFTAGFAARSDPRQAALKAWAEALTLQDGARNLDRPHGGYRQAIERGEVTGRFLKPWRQDRRYLDDYRPDFRDVVDLMCQLQIFLDPRAADRVRPWADTPAGLRLDDVPAMPDGSLAGYRRAIESKGYEIFVADLTTRDVAATGMRAVRAIVPGLIGNFAAAFPYQGKGRLRDAAVELGWRTEPLAENQINLVPLPHA
jgi:ribosomal protein S12 methylthiotransferase accessory factor